MMEGQYVTVGTELQGFEPNLFSIFQNPYYITALYVIVVYVSPSRKNP